MPQEKPSFCSAPTITLVPAFPPGRELGAAKMRLACSGARCSINVAPGSQQLHRSVAASKVA
ncbi:hypothetical protein N7527_000971 [Penicillium freii]|nr:hypothetical protein N7527_000971 [Penicillium freii]